MVWTATDAVRPSEAASVLPALKPNQPKARISVPITTNEMLWAGMALDEPSLLNLPIRGPSIIAPASAAIPPVMCTTLEPAKSMWPLPRPKLTPSCESQPPPQTQQA